MHVKGGFRGTPTMAALLKTIRRSRENVSIPGISLHCLVSTERGARETAEVEREDPAQEDQTLTRTNSSPPQFPRKVQSAGKRGTQRPHAQTTRNNTKVRARLVLKGWGVWRSSSECR